MSSGTANALEGGRRRLIDKREADGQYLVDIAFRATNQRGTVTAPATATVALPSKSGGPVLLPVAPADVQRKATILFARHRELVTESSR